MFSESIKEKPDRLETLAVAMVKAVIPESD